MMKLKKKYPKMLDNLGTKSIKNIALVFPHQPADV